MEKKTLSVKAITLLVIAGISLVLGVLFATPLTNDIAGFNFDMIATGIVLVLAGFYVITPLLSKIKGKLKSVIYFELIALVFIALFGFILPEFIKGLQSGIFSVNIWIGLLLIMHSIIHLLIDRSQSLKLSNLVFVIYILVAVLGGLLLDSKSISLDLLITLFVVLLFVAISAYLIYTALKLPKVNKKNKEKK